MLRDVIANPRTNAWDRQQAIESVVGLGPRYHDEAATALREVIANSRTDKFDRQRAAESLAELEGTMRPEVGRMEHGKGV